MQPNQEQDQQQTGTQPPVMPEASQPVVDSPVQPAQPVDAGVSSPSNPEPSTADPVVDPMLTPPQQPVAENSQPTVPSSNQPAQSGASAVDAAASPEPLSAPAVAEQPPVQSDQAAPLVGVAPKPEVVPSTLPSSDTHTQKSKRTLVIAAVAVVVIVLAAVVLYMTM